MATLRFALTRLDTVWSNTLTMRPFFNFSRHRLKEIISLAGPSPFRYPSFVWMKILSIVTKKNMSFPHVPKSWKFKISCLAICSWGKWFSTCHACNDGICHVFSWCVLFYSLKVTFWDRWSIPATFYVHVLDVVSTWIVARSLKQLVLATLSSDFVNVGLSSMLLLHYLRCFHRITFVKQ